MYRKNRGSTRIILAGGGLLSLLIVVVIIASMQTKTAETSIETKKHVEKQVEQIQKSLDEHGRVIDKMTEGSFDVILEDIGEQKIAVIEAVGALRRLDPKEAKTLVESAPAAVLTDLTKVEAENAKSKLEQAGATARIDKHNG